jgi:hypothetical protein
MIIGRKLRNLCVFAVVIAFAQLGGTAFAFHGGHTGVTEAQLKSACPAFNQGAVMLFDSVSPPGNLPMSDVFEHESGARCICTRQRTDKHSLRCGPTASAPRKD